MNTNKSDLAQVSGEAPTVSETAKVMAVLSRLGAVTNALSLLVSEQVLAPDAVIKGCRVFIKKNPCINEHWAKMEARRSA